MRPNRRNDHAFARVGAVVSLKVEDYFSQKKRWWLRLSEKNGKSTKCPVITSWKRISTLTFRLPASMANVRDRCSAPRSARPGCYPIDDQTYLVTLTNAFRPGSSA
jgi:hypothetical protein